VYLVWKEDDSPGIVLKITDVCAPDSADGVPCMDPMDIKIDRTKAGIIMSEFKSTPQGNQYSDEVWWLTKCSSDVGSSIGTFYLLSAFPVPSHTEYNKRELTKWVTGPPATCLPKQQQLVL
jgi:hypothetical protein